MATDFERRARRAYELGRLKSAVPVLAVVVPATALSLTCCPVPGVSIACGVALSLVAIALLWYGRAPGRAVWPGLLAGTIPFLAPLTVELTGHACIGGTCTMMPAACIGAGLVAGVLLGVYLARVRGDRRPSVLAAALVAALAGSLGCVMMGGAGIAGMSLGLVAGAAPAIAVLRRSEA